MRLLGKVALVTGAASGIGKEIARTFQREGAKVVIADLNQAGADAAAAELGGNDAIGVAMDVTSEAEVDAGMAKAVSAFGRAMPETNGGKPAGISFERIIVWPTAIARLKASLPSSCRRRRPYRSKTTITRFVWKNPRKIPQATINKIRGLWTPIFSVQKE